MALAFAPYVGGFCDSRRQHGGTHADGRTPPAEWRIELEPDIEHAEMVFSPDELFSLKGKTALVTGASSGIGREFALQLAHAGADVVVAARRADRLAALVEEIAKLGGGKAHALTLDVAASEEEILKGTEEAWTTFGHIDILVNNAGVFAGGPLHQTKLEDFAKNFDVNVRGLWLVSKLVTERMIEAKKKGSIINISSIAGLASGALPGMGSYSASKAAVIQITMSQAVELGPHGIRSNAICPGLFPSEMSDPFIQLDSVKTFGSTQIPARRIGVTEKDMHGVLMLLASDASEFITGQQFIVDGGQSIAVASPF